MKRSYSVSIVPEEDGRGYYALVPSLPGCFSQGATVEEAQNNIVEAIGLHIAELRKARLHIPTERKPVLQTVVSVAK